MGKLQAPSGCRFRHKQSPIPDSKSIHHCGMCPKSRDKRPFWTFSLASKHRDGAMKSCVTGRVAVLPLSQSVPLVGRSTSIFSGRSRVHFGLCCSAVPDVSQATLAIGTRKQDSDPPQH